VTTINLVISRQDGEDSMIWNDHPFTRSIDRAYLQHWLPPRRTKRLCNCAATLRPRKCVAPGRSRACATTDPWLGSLEEKVKTMKGRIEGRQGDGENADNLVVRIETHASRDQSCRASTFWPTHLLIYCVPRSPRGIGRPEIASRRDSLDIVAYSPRNSWRSAAVVAWIPAPVCRVVLQIKATILFLQYNSRESAR